MVEIPIWLMIVVFGFLGFVLAIAFMADNQDGDHFV
jgi:hypothetical protein